jgi:tetratricopeptide (TPR) repeat protein
MRGVSPFRQTVVALISALVVSLPSSPAQLLFAQNSASHPAPSPQHADAANKAAFRSIAAKAIAARDAERLDDALPLFLKGVALNPDWTEGWWSLGTIYYDNDRYADGSKAFAHVASLQPEDGTTHLMLGLCLYELGQNAEALKHLDLAAKLGIQNASEMEPILIYHQSMIALRIGHFETANHSLHILARKGTRSEEADLAFGMSVLLMSPKDLPPAGSAERATVLQLGKAEAEDSTETHAITRDMYARAVQASPEFPNIHFAFGRFLLSIQEPDAAMAEFQEELKRNPNNIRARLQIAAIDYRTDSASGIPYAEDAVKADPQYPFAHYLLGLLYLDSGNAPGAITQLELARKMVPLEPQFSFALANAYAKAHRKEDAAAARADFVRLQARATDQNTSTYYDADGQSGLVVKEKETVPAKSH